MLGLGSVNDTRNIVIGTQNTTGTGIRLTRTSGITIGGNTTFTANSNIIQSGTGRLSQFDITATTPVTGINANTYTSGGQTWVVSASSTNTSFGQIFHAFDGNTGTFWPSSANRYANGVYYNTVSTTIVGVGAVLGEWLQIQFPYPFALVEYTMQQRTGLGMRMPRVFYIVGSNDGTTWNSLQYADYANNATGFITLTNALNNNVFYSYYRLVTNAVYQGTNGNYVEMVEWNMKGFISASTATNDMMTITLNANNNLNQSGTGIISQTGTGTNTMKAITLNANNNLNQSGTGIISQSGSGENDMKAITLNTGNNLSQSGTGIISQSGSGVNDMKAITLKGGDNFTQSGSGIISQSGSGTNALKATNITGVLGITGYANVRTTLDSLTASATATTGITYNAGTDTTTIDNNVKINKNLTLQDDTRVLTAPTGYVLDETEKHTWLYQINAGFSAPRTIRVTSFDSFNIDDDTNIGVYKFSFQLVKLIKGVTYTGAFFINSTVGTFGHTYQMALYDGGVGSVSFPLARLAVSDGFPNASGTLHYVPFRDAYVSPETKFAYVGIVCATIALNPNIRTTGIDYNRRYGITTCQTGSLTSLCCGFQGATNANFDTLGATFPPAQAMTAFTYQFWCGLYTE
jgi:hypothetical protein